MPSSDFWSDALAASIRHDSPEGLFARVYTQARQRDIEHNELVGRIMGREYHLQSMHLGRIVVSDIVTVPTGRNLYLEAAVDDDNATVRVDTGGELSGRHAEARDLPANFVIMHVDTVNMGDGSTPASRFWDRIEAAVETYDEADAEIFPKAPSEPGMLTHRAVYGLAEEPRSL